VRNAAATTGQNRPKLPLGGWWPLLAVAGLLAVAAVAAALSAPRLSRVTPPDPGLSPGPVPTRPVPSVAEPTADPGAAPPGTIPTWLTTLLAVLCLAAVVVVLAIVVWVLVRGKLGVRPGTLPAEVGPAAPMRPTAEEVVAAVDAGLSDLSDTDRDPRRAVIACWVRLEQAAAAAGTPRQAGDTSTDLVVRLLDEQRVDRRVLDAFAGIFRAARYATHEVDETMRSQAISALRQLRAELTARVGPVTGP